MRVKFGNHVDWCRRAHHSYGSGLLLITTDHSLYTVDCGDDATAEDLHNKILVDGYIDVSNFDYNNHVYHSKEDLILGYKRSGCN